MKELTCAHVDAHTSLLKIGPLLEEAEIKWAGAAASSRAAGAAMLRAGDDCARLVEAF